MSQSIFLYCEFIMATVTFNDFYPLTFVQELINIS